MKKNEEEEEECCDLDDVRHTHTHTPFLLSPPIFVCFVCDPMLRAVIPVMMILLCCIVVVNVCDFCLHCEWIKLDCYSTCLILLMNISTPCFPELGNKHTF
jgi:hypothetical protein